MTGRVFAIMMVKDEADVITDTVTHLLSEGVDGIIVADNDSSDGTYELLCQLAVSEPTIRVSRDTEKAYYQSEKMSRLADVAVVEHGAEWVVPVDADELWWAGPRPFAEVLRDTPPDVRLVEAKLVNYFPTDVDPHDPVAFRQIVHRQPAHQTLSKVCARWQTDSIVHQGNHGVTLRRPGRVETLLEISHFPYRSEAQFVTKCLNGAAAYAAAVDLPPDAGDHWRRYGRLYEEGGRDALVAHYRRWFHRATPDDFDPPLVLDPAPFCRW